ncbi:MAG: hypothetical protein JW809_00825 [Pirellulales bacterium]|nr:hypothetical protein [Pirellulales bacterium]
MIARMKIPVVLLAVVTLAAVGGCSRRPSRVYPPSIDASAAGEAAMAQYDTNKDGKVAGDELAKAPSLKAAIDKLDANGDKGVSAEEVTARIKQWQDSRLGLMLVSCVFNYQGRPLSGAKVVFEPEAFLGPNVKAAEGTTDQRGNVSMTIPGGSPPGMAPGLYKVKITSDKMKVPARFNDETILGIEVANDAKGMDEGAIRFDL